MSVCRYAGEADTWSSSSVRTVDVCVIYSNCDMVRECSNKALFLRIRLVYEPASLDRIGTIHEDILNKATRRITSLRHDQSVIWTRLFALHEPYKSQTC